MIAEPLTAQEVNILRLVAHGLTYRQVANEMCIKPGTVKTHLGRIYTKLEAHNAAHAVECGWRRGYLHE